MSPKERYMAAIRHEEPDRVPIYAGLDALPLNITEGSGSPVMAVAYAPRV